MPEVVKELMPVVYMPPSTEPVDGLNKPIKKEFLSNYRHTFDDAVQVRTLLRISSTPY